MQNITLFSALYKDFWPFNEILNVPNNRCFTVDHLGVLDLAKQQSLLVFWGGQDIHPSIYNASRCVFSGATFGKDLGMRDKLEIAIYKKAVKLGIPILGICRGSQLVCALNGGKLVQHVTGHGGDHMINTSDGKQFMVTSTHHQMMFPIGNFELLGWSTIKRSNTYMGEGLHQIKECHMVDWKEPEIVFYPETKTLAVQGHPEYLRKSEEFPQYVIQLLKDKLNVGKKPDSGV